MNLFIFTFLFFNIAIGVTKEISITMDDPEVTTSPLMTSAERNQKILNILDTHKLKAALFVCGMRIDNPEGVALLKLWDEKNHLIANHSYSHLYFPGKKIL
jgi:peptidoglycan/xylan/chitin deacetylase (PgdA/CDA1 family)